MSCSSLLRPGATIAIVGEFPGDTEEKLGRPFVGAAGQELRKMLAESGIDIDKCSLHYVTNQRPAKNPISGFLCGKKELPVGYKEPAFIRGKYVKPEILPDRGALLKGLSDFRPNLIIALWNLS